MKSFWLVLAVSWAGIALGQADYVTTSASVGQSPAAPMPDRLHRGLTAEIDEMADKLDRTLGSRQEEESMRASAQSRASVLMTIWEDGTEWVGRFSARLTLPRTTRAFQILLDDRRLDREDDPFDDPLSADALDRFFRTIPVFRRFRMVYGLRANLSLRPTVGPFVKGNMAANEWILSPSALLYWHGGEGFGLRARFDLETELSPGVRFQLAPQATWSEATDGVEFQQGVMVSRPAGVHALIGAEGVVTLSVGAVRMVDNVSFAVRYRRRVWRDWFYLEGSPRIDFPRDQDYEIRPRLLLRADVLFQ